MKFSKLVKLQVLRTRGKGVSKMNIDNMQSLAEIVNLIDAQAKSDEEAQILSVSISRFDSPTIVLTHKAFIELFDEYELQATQDSSKVLVSAFMNGVEFCALIPKSLCNESAQKKQYS